MWRALIMTFDWSQYLNLAKEFLCQPTPPANQEAKMRSAISRAYYAAFISARNYLPETEEHSIPKTADAQGKRILIGYLRYRQIAFTAKIGQIY